MSQTTRDFAALLASMQRLFTAIYQRSQATGYAVCTATEIGAEIGLTERQARKLLIRLEEQGWIRKERHRYNLAIFPLRFPEGWEALTLSEPPDGFAALPASMQRLFTAIYQRSQATGYAVLTSPEIGAEIGLTAYQAYVQLIRLEEQGWIRKERRHRRLAVFPLRVPDAHPQP